MNVRLVGVREEVRQVEHSVQMIVVIEVADRKPVFCAKVLIEPGRDFPVIGETGLDVGKTPVRISRRQVLQQGKRRSVVGGRRNLGGIRSSTIRDIWVALRRIRWAGGKGWVCDTSRVKSCRSRNCTRREVVVARQLRGRRQD